MYPVLLKSPVFNGLDEQRITLLLGETHYVLKSFEKNECPLPSW